MAVAAIHTARLSKDYGLGRGLFELDLQVAQQEVFGFLGPNGAGKSTTIRLLMGLIRPTAGSAHIFGLDCIRDYVAVKKKVGYVWDGAGNAFRLDNNSWTAIPASQINLKKL